MAWISNYINIKQWGVIIHLYLIFKGLLAKRTFKLVHDDYDIQKIQGCNYLSIPYYVAHNTPTKNLELWSDFVHREAPNILHSKAS